MPGNEIEGRIRNFYELDNYSRQSQVADSNWPAHIYNQWQGKQRATSNVQQLGKSGFTFYGLLDCFIGYVF